ncbi:MAG: hypothetical protein LUC34_02905 [Campylobacter sp.]|nr:hypothetical protein [Campylobacter sp.]
MIRPKPYKVVCENCSFSKVIWHKSDCINLADVPIVCPKCNGALKRADVSEFEVQISGAIDKIKSIFK